MKDRRPFAERWKLIRRKKIEIICSYCKHEFRRHPPQPGDVVICPKCGNSL